MIFYGKTTFARAGAAILLAGTILAGVPGIADAQGRPQRGGRPGAAPRGGADRGPVQLPPRAPQADTTAPVVTDPNAKVIKALRVEGSQRIEPETVLSYTKLRVGIPYTAATLDQALGDLQASELFADYTISGVETGDIVVRVRENPIINRVILEGNKRLKDDKITKEIKLKPRQIFTRSAVRADVARIIELYRRQGRFAAVVEPKQVSLDQNRVDVVFEITEGPKSKVRQINIIGNEIYSDDKLRGEMVTKQSRWFRLLSSNTTYDQDRLNYDQQKLRQFYLTEGYADFRVTSAVAELTPDKRDFIITYVVEEGKRYKFGDVTVDSEIRDFNNEALAKSLPMKKGDWYNAKLTEDAIESLEQSAGLFGYAFTNVDPEYQKDAETLTMGLNFHIGQAQRTYVERVEINGNTNTQDKVIRREIRLAEGDAFNTFQVKRSQDRINSLGYFQDKLEIKQNPGSSPDRVVLETNVEEKSTGELQLSAGYSSLERFIVQASITQNNFRGKGQTLSLGVNYSYYSKSIQASFTEPYLLDKNVALGVDVFRRDYNSFNFLNNNRNTIFSQVSTGFQVRTGVPVSEYWSLAGRYSLSYDQVDVDRTQYFSGGECDPLLIGRYICEQIGNRWSSIVGYSLINSNLNSNLRPTAGSRFSFSQDFAGVGGDVKYLRTSIQAATYKDIFAGFIGSLNFEGGHIFSLEKSRPGVDGIRIIDRFNLGEPQFRGFQIRGVGPRVQRLYYTTDAQGNTIVNDDRDAIQDDPLGGRAYYLAKAEVEVPLGSGARELGLRPTFYVQAGSLFGLKRPNATANFEPARDANGNPIINVDGSPLLLGAPVKDNAGNTYYNNIYTPDGGTAQAVRTTTCAIGYSATVGGACTGTDVNTVQRGTPFVERFYGSSWTPRVTIGFGVNWTSPFGPLRIDIAKALVTQKGDDPKLVTFNVGTQF